MEAIRSNADESDPVRSPDPIAFIYVFAAVLSYLVPLDVAGRRQDEIYKVMNELAGIVGAEDGSSWQYSRKKCVEWTCRHFVLQDLKDQRLRPTLTRLIHTWNPQWRFRLFTSVPDPYPSM